jgi:predicted dehydrogenase/sugar phosphate isomerase/epimerase
MQNEFGVSTILFRELNLEKALDFINKTGYKWIDLTIVPGFCPHYDLDNTCLEDDKRASELFSSYGLNISSLNISPGYYNIHDSKEIDRKINRAAQLATHLKTNIITIPSGAKVEQDRWNETTNMVAGHLKRIANTLNTEYGISLSIETPHLRTLTETIDECKRFYEILDSDIIKCTLDTSHIVAGGGNHVTGWVQNIGIERINHLHLRDARKQDISYTPGKGTFDYKELFSELIKAQYSGKLIFELEYHDYPVKKKLSELRFASQYCESILTKGKLSFSLKIRILPLCLFLEGFLFNPISEIKRHEKFFMFLRQYRKWIWGLFPEKIFEGRWVKRYRFNKNKCVVQKPGSVKIVDKPSRILKIGVVGLGYAGRMHAEGFKRLNNCKIIGGFDIDPDKRDRFAGLYKCNSYSSLEDLVYDEKPDIISVCTREWLHYEAVMFCLKNKVDIFCEKLLATRIEHARKMVEAAKENNKILAVNYNYRFIPAIQKIKEVIEFKAMGKLSFFVINVHAYSYAHALDLLSFLSGKIHSVAAYNHNDPGKRIFAKTDWSVYDDDIQYIPSTALNVIVEFDNGSTGVINSSIHYPLHNYIMSIEAVFEEGIVNFNGMNMFNIKGKLSWYSNRRITAVNMKYSEKVYAKGYELSFYNSIQSFVKNYLENKKPETDGAMGLFNMELETKIVSTIK